MLAKRLRERGDRDAEHRLVTSHLRLVAKIVTRYRGYGLPAAEMISEGNLGLIQAVRRFDPEMGFRLSTYAMWWIRASIQEYVLRSWGSSQRPTGWTGPICISMSSPSTSDIKRVSIGLTLRF
jgi:RNA polymerase sigma-32 factor